ncbi:MAG: hemerythrin [Gammaproteobacteria bacterium]|jgi:hemerythrin
MQKTGELIWQDSQHQVLFDLMEKIKRVPFDPQILVRLKLCAEHHFILEEVYMEKLCYPDAVTHCRAYD